MKKCEICWDEFEESKSNQKYCKSCGKNPERARRRLVKAERINKINSGEFYASKTRTCFKCGTVFSTISNRNYCSEKCKHENQYEKFEKAKCEICGRLLSEVGNFTGRGTCSEACKRESNTRKAIIRGDYIPCKECGKRFITKGYDQYCSRECEKNAQISSKKIVGGRP